jgi:hypothetical protein
MAYKRYRQMNPKKFDKRSFRVKEIDEDTKLVIGCPKGKYSPKKKKCKVGTKVQSILRKK